MTESPEQMIRRILAELYPRPHPWAGVGEAANRTAAALRAMSAALALGTAGRDLRPDETWGVEEGC